MYSKKRWIDRRLIGILLLVILLLLLSFYETLLRRAGDFLAPERIEEADAIIIESSELVREGAIQVGVDFITQKKANLLVVVYQNSDRERILGKPTDYGLYITTKLREIGLKKEEISVLEVPKEHPITLIEAQIVLSHLAKRGVQKAILIAESFHTRRSFWAYRNVGQTVGIKIYPYPLFIKFQKDSWWKDHQGKREFVIETGKFLYYLFSGYIPIESLCKI